MSVIQDNPDASQPMKKKKDAKIKKRKKPIQRRIIRAAGGLLWRETEQGRELALVHRPRYDDWVLPKGHLDKGEGWEDAAVREVTEETCCQAQLGDYAGSISYLVNDKPKLVLFWHMSLAGENSFVPNGETDQLLWVTAEEALEKLAYSTERALVAQAQ